MKLTAVLLLTIVAVLFSKATSKSVRELFETRGMNDVYENEGNDADLQKRGYYWIVSEWGPCECQDGQETGFQYRDVSCTTPPCHFIRAPFFKKSCQCY